MTVTLIVFGVVFGFFTGSYIILNKKNLSRLGRRIFTAGRKLRLSELVLYLFRFIISLAISIYFISKGGETLQINLLIFAIIMGALSSKIFAPVGKQIFLKETCGVFENGVITFQGVKLFNNLDYYSYSLKSDEYTCAFVPKKPYFDRPGYFYIKQRDMGKISRLLAGKCVCK